jgi:NADPH:quinone reductase
MSMKAWAINKAGGPEVLEHVEIAKPTLTLPRDILVKVKAVALNPVDYKVRKNYSGANAPRTCAPPV